MLRGVQSAQSKAWGVGVSWLGVLGVGRRGDHTRTVWGVESLGGRCRTCWERYLRTVIFIGVCRMEQMRGEPADREKEKSIWTASSPGFCAGTDSAGCWKLHHQDTPCW